MAYPGVSDLKAYMGISGSDLDTQLTLHLDGAISFIEAYCVRSFVGASSSKNFPVRLPYVNKSRLRLMLFQDFTACSSITNGDGVLIASGDYDLLPYNGPIYHAVQIRMGASVRFTDSGTGDPVVVAATWGLDTPDSIFLAVMQTAKFLYESSKQGSGGPVQASSRQSGLAILASKLPDHVMAVLDTWKRVPA